MDSLRLLTRGGPVRIANIASKAQTDGLPSSGVSSKKRKRDDEGIHHDSNQDLTEAEIRTIQKQQNIKITDLKSLQQDRNVDNKKARKESARLYPQPLLSFKNLSHYDANNALCSNLVAEGYKEPTEVQLATLPVLMQSGKQEPNLLTVAPTGSGKTLAFLIPTIAKICKTRTADSLRRTTAIILAPTKELVDQIVNEGRKLAANTGVQITAFKKGMRLHEELASTLHDAEDDSDGETNRPLLVKADILVSAPGSLQHAISSKDSDAPLPLPNISTLILDEADVLLDPLFRDQTLAIWQACTNASLRTSLWSATIGASIEDLAISTITSKHPKSPAPLIRTVIGLKDTSLPSISHQLIYAASEQGKLTGLRNLLHPTSSSSAKPALRPPFLIFTQTIDRAQALHRELLYDIPSLTSTNSTQPRIAVLHSQLTTPQRSAIMTSVRQGKTWILITTDLLSRGIDFKGMNGVVNYDIPVTTASYVHRAGRTGRAGRDGGVCVTFYTNDDVKYLRPIANVIKKSEGKGGEKSSVPDWLLSALPEVGKNAKKELKMRGVGVRRAVKESDDKDAKRAKKRNTIGTKSGYAKRVEDRRKGAVEGSKRRKEREAAGDEGSDGGVSDFSGFD